MTNPDLKFIADAMLGKLAKRLRILGYDTLFLGDAPDRQLIKISKEEGRLLITRDTNIPKIRGVNACLITSTDIEGQLKEMIAKLKVKIDHSSKFSRCSECNEPLIEIEKERIKDKVPKRVFESFNEFKTCPKCKRIYWHGTHFERLNKEFEKL